MLEKDREDFTNMLRGRTVPGANPKIVKKAKACRDVLLEWKEQEELPLLRLPKEPVPPRIWEWQLQFTYAVMIVLVIIPLFIFVPSRFSDNGQPIQPPLREIEKSEDFVYNNISILNPQEEAMRFYKELLAINIKVTTPPKLEGNVWRLNFQWQPSQADALADILARYRKKLPPDIFNSATLGFKDDETKTTQFKNLRLDLIYPKGHSVGCVLRTINPSYTLY